MPTSSTANDNRSAQQKQRRLQHASQAWVDMIAKAGNKATATTSQSDHTTMLNEIQLLETARDYLESRRNNWNQFPDHEPPPRQQQQQHNAILIPSQVSAATAAAPKVEMITNSLATYNPFSAFGGDNTNDDDDALSDNGDSNDDNEHMQEREVVVTMTNENSSSNLEPQDDSGNLMTMRRLLIRVLTTISELHVRITNMYRRGGGNDKNSMYWTEGVDRYEASAGCLQRALSAADEEYTRLFVVNQGEHDVANNHQKRLHLLRMKQLADDAEVVMIALDYFSKQHDRYCHAAKRRGEYLQNKLTPQWQDRDEIKAKIGVERWNNNPNPKYDYARQREENENELRAIEQAMDKLVYLKSNIIDDVYERSQTIFESAASSSTTTTTSNKSNRYNGIRPNYYQESSSRVSFEDYPDPTEFGWTFTGSVETSFVEMFEKYVPNNTHNNNNNNNNDDMDDDDCSSITSILVKLDWYYTTATIKTSMDHPTKGLNQLFGKQVTPEEYIQILLNPRTHTNVRYRYRTSNNNNNNNGRGDGYGRGSSNGRFGAGSDRDKGRVRFGGRGVGGGRGRPQQQQQQGQGYGRGYGRGRGRHFGGQGQQQRPQQPQQWQQG